MFRKLTLALFVASLKRLHFWQNVPRQGQRNLERSKSHAVVARVVRALLPASI
jgi:hypothetical protein